MMSSSGSSSDGGNSSDGAEQVPIESPQRSEASPPRSEASAQRSEASPERSEASPERSDGSPQRSDGSPERSEASPARSEASPVRSEGSPQRSEASPPDTPMSHDGDDDDVEHSQRMEHSDVDDKSDNSDMDHSAEHSDVGNSEKDSDTEKVEVVRKLSKSVSESSKTDGSDAERNDSDHEHDDTHHSTESEKGEREPKRKSKSSSKSSSDEERSSDEGVHKKSASQPHFTLGDSDDGSKSPPSERQPSPPERRRVMVSSDEDEGSDEPGPSGTSKKAGLEDIDLSDSSGGDHEDGGHRHREEFTEDDIVGPRLYPDPEAGGDDEEMEKTMPTIVEVSTARICPNFGGEGLYFVKFPNFLSIEPRPFDPSHYEDEFDEDEVMDEEGRARLKLRVENTVRFRYALDKEGNVVKQSNTKVVKWSDGSISMYLGNEMFDVLPQPMKQDNHLFMRQGAGLQGHAVFREKLTFRPSSTKSVTHRKMTMSMADRTNKSQKVKVLHEVGTDPESRKAELVRREEERLRAQNRREAQMRRNRMRPANRGVGLTTSYLEEREVDSDEESVAVRRRERDDKPLIGASDSDESDTSRLHDAKRDSDKSESDSEMKKKQKKKVIIEDDDE